MESYINIARNGANKSEEEKTLAETREELKNLGKEAEEATTTTEKKLPDVKEAPHANTVEWYYTGIKGMVKDNLLANKDIIVLADLLTELAYRLEEQKPKITVSDIDDMLASI